MAAAAAAPHPAPRRWSRRVSSVVVACCDDDGCDDSCDDGCAGIEPAATAASCSRGTRFLRGAFAIAAAHAREMCSHFASLGPSSCQIPSSHSCERARPPGSGPCSTSSAAATPSGRSSRGCRRRRRCRRHSRPSICPSRVCPWGQKTRAADAPGPKAPSRRFWQLSRRSPGNLPLRRRVITRR